MHPQHDKILGLIARLKTTNENFVRNSGLGYCACASVELKKELNKLSIEGKLLYGKHLSDNPAGNKAKAHFKNLVQNFPTGNDFHGRVKRYFIKNGNQLSGKGGHVGVLVKDTVYDVTSAQFGLPITYPLDRFLGMWDTAAIVEITMKPSLTSWKQDIKYSYKSKDMSAVAQEGYSDALEYAMQGCVDMSDAGSDKEDFYQWFSVQSKEVQVNGKIVSAEDCDQDYMLHIDKQTPAIFVPRLPKSAAKSENDTTARITVAPNLVGCMIGYARIEADVTGGTSKDKVEKTQFRGGYDICELPFKHCLFPNEKLVFDSQRSQEHWLVSYNKETLEYKPTKVGKLFISKITYETVTGKEPVARFEIYIEVNKEGGFKFSPGIYLDKGFYRATVSFDRENDKGSVNEERHFKVEPINPEGYKTAKQLSAAMLSHQDKVPKYLNW